MFLLIVKPVLIEVGLAQRLPLPARRQEALSGSQVMKELALLNREEREARIFREVLSGNIPDFLRNLVPVHVSDCISGNLRSAMYRVAPDYLALGSDGDYILTPMTPVLAQRIADTLGFLLPTKQMVDQIYDAAPCKLNPQPIPPSPAMATVPVFVQHNDSVRVQRSASLSGFPAGTLVAGHKKDVIISNSIFKDLRRNVPHPVVIYGWHRGSGKPIQPLFNGHGATYADYSHGIRLVSANMLLDGLNISMETILADSTLWRLLSDEGPIPTARYPIPSAGADSSGAH